MRKKELWNKNIYRRSPFFAFAELSPPPSPPPPTANTALMASSFSLCAAGIGLCLYLLMGGVRRNQSHQKNGFFTSSFVLLQHQGGWQKNFKKDLLYCIRKFLNETAVTYLLQFLINVFSTPKRNLLPEVISFLAPPNPRNLTSSAKKVFF